MLHLKRYFATLCIEIKNLKESEVHLMRVMKTEIVIKYSMMTSVCAF